MITYTADQAAEYQANCAAHFSRHKELTDEYTHPEFKLRGVSGGHNALETELSQSGEKLFYMPPLEEVNGVWLPKRKGLTQERITDTPMLVKPMEDLIPEEQWDSYIANQDSPPSIAPWITEVLDQGQVGACTCGASAGGARNTLHFIGRDGGPFNMMFTYRHVNGGRDAGSSLEDVIAFGQQTGLCPSSVWNGGWREKPPQAAYDAAAHYKLGEVYAANNRLKFANALLRKKGVHFWYDGHSVWAVGLLSRTMFDWLNTWGYDWGNNGRGTMSLSSLSYSGFYVYGSMGHS
jgi:hypothetical protein